MPIQDSNLPAYRFVEYDPDPALPGWFNVTIDGDTAKVGVKNNVEYDYKEDAFSGQSLELPTADLIEFFHRLERLLFNDPER